MGLLLLGGVMGFVNYRPCLLVLRMFEQQGWTIKGHRLYAVGHQCAQSTYIVKSKGTQKGPLSCFSYHWGIQEGTFTAFLRTWGNQGVPGPSDVAFV